MKTAIYPTTDGQDRVVEYDENSPCTCCGLPVIEASMGGPALCPWCDMGIYRDGSRFTIEDLLKPGLIPERAKTKLAQVGIRTRTSGHV
jgi:hypothetical protein